MRPSGLSRQSGNQPLIAFLDVGTKINCPVVTGDHVSRAQEQARGVKRKLLTDAGLGAKDAKG